VIATEEEDIVARVQEITGGKGARVIFDPVAGPFLEKLAAAAATAELSLSMARFRCNPRLSAVTALVRV